MRILAIDPGGTTGLAMRVEASRGGTRIITSVVTTARELITTINGQDVFPFDLVIVENFQANNLLDMYGHYTVELIGAIKALCTLYTIPYVVQPPAYRMSHMKEAREWHAANGWLGPRPLMRHAVDALAHLFAYEEKGPPKRSVSVRETKWRAEE